MTDCPYPIPMVRLIVPDSTGMILLLKRSNTLHAQGSWCLPGGKIDYGLTIEAACKKELLEETGLACAGLRFLFFQDSLPPVPGQMHGINFYFECKARGNVTLNRESSQYQWIDPQTIHSFVIAFKNDEAILRYWKEYARTRNSLI